MAMSQEMRDRFDENRLRMNKMERRFQIYMWLMIALGAVVFFSAFIAGALSTTNKQNVGPEKFYMAMSAGTFQILLGLATIILGWITAAKKRVPSLILLAVYFIGFVLILTQKNGTFAIPNIIFLMAGMALNIWVQMLFNENELLKVEPGYPLFSPEASERAHYEVPLNVRMRAAEGRKKMESLGGTGSAAMPEPEIPQPAVPQQPAVSLPEPAFEPDPDGFSNPKPLGPTPSVRRPDSLNIGGPVILAEPPQPHSSVTLPEPPQQPAQPVQSVPVPQVQLDDMAAAQAGRKAVLPQVSAETMLADMTAIPSHATQQGNPDLLPTPEEVRARLAAMKRARKEHPSENS